MKYSRVYMDAMGYELPPVVVTSGELEDRLAPLYESLRISPGQLEALTGIAERRWWETGYSLSTGAVAAAKKALQRSNVRPQDIECLIYAGVCRENFEPATAFAVADGLGIPSDAYVYDVSNACIGVLNGIIDVANRIELKQIRAGMVVSCESAREITEVVIAKMLAERNMECFRTSVATLTGGSGAAAILLTDGSFDRSHARRLAGAATQAAPQHHRLCRWGITLSPVELSKLIFSPDKLLTAVNDIMQPEALPTALRELMTSDRLPPVIASLMPADKLPAALTQFMSTDSVSVLKHGVELGVRTWAKFLGAVGWAGDQVDKIITHQVGNGHRDSILKAIGVAPEKDFSTFRYLGNMGTVSLPLTAALAEQRRFLQSGDRVGFLGIGSGLNCLMLGWDW